MKVVPVEFDLDLTQNAPGYVRTPGLHMSDIYNAYYEKTEPKRYGKIIEPGAKAGYQGLGLALEEGLEESLVRRLTGDGRPGEFVELEHGIIYSPDLLLFLLNGIPLRVAEIKLTWMSSSKWPKTPTNGFPAKANKYLTQLLLSTRCLGTPYARIYAVFVNGTWQHGDTKWGFKPQPLAWDIEFTRREQDEEWQAMMGFARKAGMIK